MRTDESIKREVKFIERISRRSAIAAGISDARLTEICNAERDGRCVVLPCKPEKAYWHREYGSGELELNFEMLTPEQIADLRDLERKATPGPWKWSCAPCNQQILLVTDHSGEYFVMGFDRWGMHNAAPTFQKYEKSSGPLDERGSKGMFRADKLCKSIPGKEHHKGFDDYIDHPDAEFIARSRSAMPALLFHISVLEKALEMACESKSEELSYHGQNNSAREIAGAYVKRAQEELRK